MSKFRVGIYGTGRGSYLARLFARHDDVQIVAGCAFDPTRLASFASSFPDFRDPEVRERYRNDHFRCPRGEAVRETEHSTRDHTDSSLRSE